MRTTHRIAMHSLMVLALATSMVLAQSADERCGQVTKASGETESSVQACMNELFDEQLLMVDAIERMGQEMRAISLSMLGAKGMTDRQRTWLLGVMGSNDDDIQWMRNGLQRAREENVAVEDSDHDGAFENADQQKGKDCKFSDLPFVESLAGEFPPGLKPYSGTAFDPKFGDGKCNVFKARIDNPGEPDDNAVVRINERSENMCERVCDDRLSDSTVSGFGGLSRPRREERKERVVLALTDNIAAARRANEALETGTATMAGLRVQMAGNAFRIAGDATDSCEPLDVARILDEAAEVSGLVKNTVAAVTATLELLKETARPPSKQDVAGFNASTAETPFSVAVGFSKILQESVGWFEQALKVAAVIAGRIQDFAQAQCLQRVQTQLSGLQETADQTDAQLDEANARIGDANAQLGETRARLDEANAQLAALTARLDAVNARIDEVLELLRTPPGRRDGFPSKP